jgi:hypothetical protein
MCRDRITGIIPVLSFDNKRLGLFFAIEIAVVVRVSYRVVGVK